MLRSIQEKSSFPIIYPHRVQRKFLFFHFELQYHEDGGLEKINFLCITGHFIQFITNIFAALSNPLWDRCWYNDLSMQIWTFHAILRKFFFLQLYPNPHGGGGLHKILLW